MAKILLFLCAVVFSFEAHAKPRKNNYYPQATAADNATAQSVAETCARTGVLRHLGGNHGLHEGIGTGPTPESALGNCCFAGQMNVVDQGVAQGRSGKWFACIRGHVRR